MKKHICTRCGKVITHIHYLDGLPVCADDRLCYPGKNLPKKLKKLEELRHRYADSD